MVTYRLSLGRRTVTVARPRFNAFFTFWVSHRDTKAICPSYGPAFTTVAWAAPEDATVLTTAVWFCSRNGSTSSKSMSLS